MKIYIDKFKRKRKTTINNILNIFLEDSYNMGATYFDKECTILQCRSGKARSLDDLILIVKTYFPQATDKTILKNIYKRLINHYNYAPSKCIYNCGECDDDTCGAEYILKLIIFCPDVGKPVVQRTWGLSSSSYNGNGNLYFNIIYNYDQNLPEDIKSGDKYSIYDFLKINGFTDDEINDTF